MTIAGRRLVLLSILGALVSFLLGLLAALTLLDDTSKRFAFLYDDFSIANCVKDLEAKGPPPADSAARREAVDLCYSRLVRQGQINEFQIRRVSFESQHIADRVVLWMVVCLTLSGVALAAVQIVASSNLFGGQGATDSEFSVEKGKVFLRSSITGLFILLISFAFFYTYIIFVYQIVELGPTGKAENTAPVPPALPRLEGVKGGLGPPPGAPQ